MIFSTRNPDNALEMHNFLELLYTMREKVRGVCVNGFNGEIRIDLHSKDAETEILNKYTMALGTRRAHEGTELLGRIMSEFGHGTEPSRGDAEHLYSLLSGR
jgi:hypothetical protein